MYRYSECVWDFPHRITGDGHQRLMNFFGAFPKEQTIEINWDDEDIEYLIELYRKNHTFDFIADVLERSVDGIRAKVKALHRAGILPYRGNLQTILREKRKQYIKRNYRYGIEYCIRHFDCAPYTVRKYAREMGLVA